MEQEDGRPAVSDETVAAQLVTGRDAAVGEVAVGRIEREGDAVAAVAGDEVGPQDATSAVLPVDAVDAIVGDEILLEYRVGGEAEPEAVVAPASPVAPEHVATGEGRLEGVVGRVGAVVADDEVVVGGRTELVTQEEPIARPAQVVPSDAVPVRAGREQDASSVAARATATVHVVRAVALEPAVGRAVQADPPGGVVREVTVRYHDAAAGDETDPGILAGRLKTHDPARGRPDELDTPASTLVTAGDIEERTVAPAVVREIAVLDEEFFAVDGDERPGVATHREVAQDDATAANEHDADTAASTAIEQRSLSIEDEVLTYDAERTVGRVREHVMPRRELGRCGDDEPRARLAETGAEAGEPVSHDVHTPPANTAATAPQAPQRASTVRPVRRRRTERVSAWRLPQVGQTTGSQRRRASSSETVSRRASRRCRAGRSISSQSSSANSESGSSQAPDRCIGVPPQRTRTDLCGRCVLWIAYAGRGWQGDSLQTRLVPRPPDPPVRAIASPPAVR